MSLRTIPLTEYRSEPRRKATRRPQVEETDLFEEAFMVQGNQSSDVGVKAKESR